MRSAIQGLVPYNPGPARDKLEKEIGKKLTILSTNESLWGPAPAVLEALRGCLEKTGTYPDGGAGSLKSALCSLWGLKKGNFCLGNGADELIFMLPAAFLDPGEEVLIPTPTFSEYEAAATITGAVYRMVPHPQLAFNLDTIASAVTAKTKMIFLCNPNNPTGTSFKHAEICRFMERIPKHILVILDEAYCHFANDPDFPRSSELLGLYKNMLVLRTFSKVFSLASLRIGYAVGAEALIRELEKIRQPFNANLFAQAAATAALADDNHTQRVIAETIAEREWLTAKLTALGCEVIPSQSNFLLVKTVKDALETVKVLQNEGIQVRGAASFGLPQWIRITVAPHPVMENFYNTFKMI